MDRTKGGTKYDQGKAPLGLVPRVALEMEAQVMGFGAKKYGRHNYTQGFDYSRLVDAALRHIVAFNDGEDLDPESGLSHLGHARCCLGMLMECISLGTAVDDRRVKCAPQNEVTTQSKSESTTGTTPSNSPTYPASMAIATPNVIAFESTSGAVKPKSS